MIKTTFFIFFLVAVFIFSFEANAEILSFTASPSSISNAELTSLVWSSQNLSGVKIILPCIRGIKYNNENGASITCDSPILDLATSGAYSFSVINLNTLSSTIQAKALPKNAYGAYDESSPVYASLSVAPISTVITKFTASAEDIESPSEITFSWEGQYIAGIKITVSCAENIRFTYEGDTRISLPCDITPFANDLGPAASIKFKFFNESGNDKLITVSIIPAMGDGTYDATRSKSIQVKIRPPVPKIPKINLLSAVPKTTVSGSGTIFSWGGENIAGVNFIISCEAGISATSSLSATSTLPCNNYTLPNNLPATSSVTFYFKNANYGSTGVFVKIVPFLANNTYDTTRANEVRLDVLAESVSPVSPPAVTVALPPLPVPLPSVTSTSTLLPSPAILLTISTTTLSRPPEFTYTFTKPLYYGLRENSDVLALQKILVWEGLYSGLQNGSFFGLTQEALKSFQRKYSLAPLGNVGPLTRAKLNALYGGQVGSATPTVTKQIFFYTFSRPLYYGLVNDQDVKALQQILVLEGVYSGSVTGNYFTLTAEAVKKFQKKYRIDQLGNVGLKTRGKLNALYSK